MAMISMKRFYQTIILFFFVGTLGCAHPISPDLRKNLDSTLTFEQIIENPETVATAIRIGNPASWDFAEKALKESLGQIDAIDDDDIIEGYKMIASMEGIFAEPASCITIAGLYHLKKLGYDFSGKTIVCILTGNGLKDPDFANNYLNFQINKMNPEFEELENFLLS